jgi:hypothetical protein
MNLHARAIENQRLDALGEPRRWQTNTTHGAPCDVCDGTHDEAEQMFGQEVWLYCAMCGGCAIASSFDTYEGCGCPPEDWLVNRTHPETGWYLGQDLR